MLLGLALSMAAASAREANGTGDEQSGDDGDLIGYAVVGGLGLLVGMILARFNQERWLTEDEREQFGLPRRDGKTGTEEE